MLYSAPLTATFFKRLNAIMIHGVVNKYLWHYTFMSVLRELHFDKKKYWGHRDRRQSSQPMIGEMYEGNFIISQCSVGVVKQHMNFLL